MDLYVYYRAASAQAEALRERVTAMQAELARRCGVAAALKRRPEAKDGRHTWMETYLNIPDGFDAILSQAVTQSELASLIDGERHTEYFLDITTCA
jgi:DNA-binding XRE family transcriptional regulator